MCCDKDPVGIKGVLDHEWFIYMDIPLEKLLHMLTETFRRSVRKTGVV